MRHNRLVPVFMVMIAVLLHSDVHANSPVKEPIRVGSRSPDFSIKDLNGETRSLEQLLSRHKAVILNFWGLRCGACIQELPHLNALSKKYDGKIAILGVNVDAVEADFLKTQIANVGIQIDYAVIPDPEFKLIDLYKMTAAPYTVIIDQNGTLRFLHENYAPGDEAGIEKVVVTILGEARLEKK